MQIPIPIEMNRELESARLVRNMSVDVGRVRLSLSGEHSEKAAPPKDEPPIDIDDEDTDTDGDDQSRNGNLRCAPPQDQQNPQPPEAEAGQSGSANPPPEGVNQPESFSVVPADQPEQLASSRLPLVEISPSNIQNREDIERDRSPLGNSKPDSKEPKDMDNRPPRRNNRRRPGFRNGMNGEREEHLEGRVVEPAVNVAQPIHVVVGGPPALQPQQDRQGGAQGNQDRQVNRDEELDNAANEQNEAQEREEEQENPDEPEPDAADREVQGLLRQAGAPGLRGRPRVRRNSNERNDNEGDRNRNNGDDAAAAAAMDVDDNDEANANAAAAALPNPPRIRNLINPDDEEHIPEVVDEFLDPIDPVNERFNMVVVDVVDVVRQNGLGARQRRDAFRGNNPPDPDFLMVIGENGGLCTPYRKRLLQEDSLFKDEGRNRNFLIQGDDYSSSDIGKLTEILQDAFFEHKNLNPKGCAKCLSLKPIDERHGDDDDEREQVPAVFLRDDSFETLMGLSPNKETHHLASFDFNDTITYSASFKIIRETNLMFLYLLRSEVNKIEEKKFKLLPEHDHSFDYPGIIDTFQQYMEGFSASHLRRSAFALASSVDLNNLSYYSFMDNISRAFKGQGMRPYERALFVMFAASDILLRALNNQEITYFYRLYHWITIFLADLVSNWAASYEGWENIFCLPLVGEKRFWEVTAVKQLLCSIGITLGFATIGTMLFYKFRK